MAGMFLVFEVKGMKDRGRQRVVSEMAVSKTPTLAIISSERIVSAEEISQRRPLAEYITDLHHWGKTPSSIAQVVASVKW